MRRFPTLPLLLVLALTSLAFGQKKPLDPAAYDIWKTLRPPIVSTDGKWVMYTLAPQDGDAVVEVKSTDLSRSYVVERGTNVQFSEDNRFLIAIVQPRTE